MFRQWRRFAVALVVLAIGTAAGSAQEKSGAADLEAIKKSADAFTAAYNGGDAKAIAALFTAEAEFVDGLGNVSHGRAEIEQEFADFFELAGKSKIVIDMETVRLVSPGVLIEEGASTIVPADGSPVTASRYVVVHAQQKDGKWLMASVRGTRDEPVSAHEYLKQLEWLVGAWVDESPESTVETTWRWSEDGNYLLSDFDVKIRGTAVMKGTQRLAWDASHKQIRSWIFDSEGGAFQGVWTASDDGWLVKTTGVSAAGEPGSATNYYVRTGKDSFVWSSVDRVVGDEILPDLEVVVVRQAPAPSLQTGAKPAAKPAATKPAANQPVPKKPAAPKPVSK
jgi:uncharacterized protein (TIGR02246 family)